MITALKFTLDYIIFIIRIGRFVFFKPLLKKLMIENITRLIHSCPRKMLRSEQITL